MAVVLRTKNPFQAFQRIRVAIAILFVMSTMGMLSLHMSGRTYVPRFAGSSAVLCSRGVSLDERRRSSEDHTRAGELEVKPHDKQETPLVSKKPSLKELKSLRVTLDKAITVMEGGKKIREMKKMEKMPPHYSTALRRRAFQKSTKLPKPTPTDDGIVFSTKTGYRHTQDNVSAVFFHSGTPIYSGTRVGVPIVEKKVLTYQDTAMMNITRLKPIDSTPAHELSAKDPYRSRILNIDKACRSNPDGNSSSLINLKRMINDDGHRVLMCVIPKAACTTWKSIMFYLMGHSTIQDAFDIKRSRLVLEYGQLKSMGRISGQHVIDRLNAFTKFTVSRHPYHRLVSAYRNKFEQRMPSYVYTHGRNIAKKILEEYLNGTRVTFVKKRRQEVLEFITTIPAFKKLLYKDRIKVIDVASRGYAGNITFEEFLRYGIVADASNSRHFDVHWRPQHVLCNPCAFGFDFVIRFEDIERESNMVLNYLQRNDPEEKRIKFPGGSPAAVTNTVTKQFFDKVPPDLKEAIRKVYEKDFEYFNYDPNTL